LNSTSFVATSIAKREINFLPASVLKALLYYDLFSYPLTAEEIKSHCRVVSCSLSLVQEALDELCGDNLIFRYEKFYSVHNNAGLFLRRKKGNEAAARVMDKVNTRSRLIANFPFVRCICISGSLSKNYFDEEADVDFFIITEPNRLWVCRTFLILFKKLFLLNSKKYFCVNYFIDSDNLVIPDKNIFTSIELITLKPVHNYELYEKFFTANHWVKTFFPNSSQQEPNGTPQLNNNWIRNGFEKLLGGKAGEWLDQFFMIKTLEQWKKKFGWLPSHEFELNMRTRRNVSKHHPQGFQVQVLKKYEERILSFEAEHQITLR
jgi:hypothetical protein